MWDTYAQIILTDKLLLFHAKTSLKPYFLLLKKKTNFVLAHIIVQNVQLL